MIDLDAQAQVDHARVTVDQGSIGIDLTDCDRRRSGTMFCSNEPTTCFDQCFDMPLLNARAIEADVYGLVMTAVSRCSTG